MDYLLISNNIELCSRIHQTIGPSKRPQQRLLSEALSYLEQQFPDAVLLDFSSFGDDSLKFISSLRSLHPLANILVVAITTASTSPLCLEKLSLFSNITQVDTTQIEQELSLLMEISIAQHLTERDETLAHPYTLEQMADIWREGQSVRLLLHNHRSLKLQMGGVLRLEDLEQMKEMFFSPPTHVESVATETTGDWIAVGDLLWTEVQKWCSPGFLRYRKWLRFLPTNQAHRAMDLDLDLQTRRLLFATDEQMPLLNRLRAQSLRIQQVERDIEALYLLGLYHFSSTETTKIEATGHSSYNALPALPEKEFQQFLVEAINEDWTRRLDPHPWSAFGLRPDHSLDKQIQDKLDLYSLYQQVQSPSAQRKLTQLTTYLKSLETYLSPLLHLYEIYGYPEDFSGEEETQFYLGYRLLQQRSIESAHTAFSKLPTDNIRYQAYQGWTLFLLDQANAKEAFQMLTPAILTEKSSPLFQCYAAVLQTYLNQWRQAEQRMRTLIQQRNFEQFRSLLWYCQSRSIPSTCWVYRY